MTGMLEPNAPLLPVANAISDGEPVDWPAVESSAGEEAERALVRDLRVVAEIVALHRQLAPLPDVAAATIMDELVEESARSGSPRDPSVPIADQSHLPTWGHLQLTELVGGGAFGEVYRARDPRLDRDVALKLVRRRESAQPRASAVVDEGRLLARVRHPNVITVFGADRIQGHVGVWMEFIQGRTLEQDLQARGPFAPEEVARIGVDVCRALEAVHRAGLLHRDVKAQNVMREPDGRIVLMDFGAGREDDAEGAVSDLAGTPLYLAPEIFGGGVASPQSDLYSLGVLLYRLLTSSYPVAGRTLADVRAAHARGERGSLREARPEVPRKLAECIEHALAHDPAERFASATAMEAALTTIVEPSRTPGRLWTRNVAAALVALAVIVTVGILWDRSRPSRQGNASRLSQAGGPPTLHRVEGVADVLFNGIPSLDGRYLPFTESTTGDLAVLEVATGKRRRLTNNPSGEASDGYAVYSVVSADGSQVAYTWEHKDGSNDLRVVGIDGGPTRVLFSDPDAGTLQVADWSRDGKYLLVAFPRKDKSGHIGLVSVADGSFKQLESGDFIAGGLSLSPDGRYVVYDRPSGGATDPRDIYLLATDGSRDEPLVRDPANDVFPLWTPDGRGVIFASDRSGRLGAWLVRVHDGKPDGPPEVVNKDMGPMMPVGITGQGAYYYMLRTGMVDVYQAELDPVSGKARQAPTPVTRSFAGSNISPDWSPDGRSLAYVSQRGALYVGPGSRVLVIRDLESGRERELTPNLPFYIHPRWSPDSRSIAVKDTGTNGGSQGMQIHQIDARTGTMDRIDVNVGTEFAWTRDGRSLFFGTPEGSIRLRNLATGQDKDVFRPDSSSGAQAFALSPDEDFIAITGGDGSGQSWIRVVPVGGGAERGLIRATRPEALGELAWTPDGRFLLFVKIHDVDGNGPRDVWRIPVEGGPAGSIGVTMTGLRELRMHPDGSRIAFTAGWPLQELWVGENFLSQPPK